MDKAKLEAQIKDALASVKDDREALAEILVEFLQPGHITTDFVGMLLNTRRLKKGDILVKKVRKGIKVRTLVPGSIHLKDEITVSERANYILDGADVGVQFNEWELESGELGSVQEIRREMLLKLRDYYQNKVFTALTTIWTAGNTPDNYTTVASALNAATLKTAIDYVNQTVGSVRAVVGTREILTPVTTFGGFWSDGTSLHRVDSQLEEVMRTGWLGKYYGADIVTVPQDYDNPEDYNAMIPNNKVLVIGENVGEFVVYDEPRYKEWVNNEPTPPYWNLEIYQQFGMIIDRAQGIYVIEIT
jgi:hypothetical protein